MHLAEHISVCNQDGQQFRFYIACCLDMDHAIRVFGQMLYTVHSGKNRFQQCIGLFLRNGKIGFPCPQIQHAAAAFRLQLPAQFINPAAGNHPASDENSDTV